MALFLLTAGVAVTGYTIKNKNKSLALCFALLYLFLIYTFCNGGSPDLDIYKLIFEKGLYGDSFLTDALMNLTKLLGGNFIVFKLVCATVTLVIAFITLKKTTPYVALVLVLYLIFPFFDSIAQIKNGLMGIVVCYGIVQFICDKKHKIFRYILIILIAALIQPTALFYLSFILVKLFNIQKKNSNIKFITLVIAIILLIMLCIQFNLLYSIARKLIKNEKYLVYFNFEAMKNGLTDEMLNWKGKVSTIICHLFGYFLFRLIYISYKTDVQKIGYEALRAQYGKYYKFILNREQLEILNRIFLISFIIIPFYFFNPTYLRLFKNILLILYIVVSQYLVLGPNNRVIKAKSKKYLALTVCYAIFMLFMSSYSQGYFFEGLNSFSVF